MEFLLFYRDPQIEAVLHALIRLAEIAGVGVGTSTPGRFCLTNPGQQTQAPHYMNVFIPRSRVLAWCQEERQVPWTQQE